VQTTIGGLLDTESGVEIQTLPRPIRVFKDLGLTGRPREQAARERPEARRAINVIVALIGIVLLAPVMLLIAIAVKLSSRGPILYTQLRVGVDRRGPNDKGGDGRRQVDYGGKLFKIYKFRSMSVAKTGSAEVWARPDDPRTTSIGRVLRKYRLDELPQLFNVLKGDMNVVGPRPEQPAIFMNLRQQVHRYADRQQVLPGITGLAQVNLTYDRCVDDVRKKVTLDIQYVQQASAIEDIKIMLKTFPVILLQRGAW
jgi:lipopolysaccharide/colanic/teichoic acid biosynthesis glycosyltransferase